MPLGLFRLNGPDEKGLKREANCRRCEVQEGEEAVECDGKGKGMSQETVTREGKMTV